MIKKCWCGRNVVGYFKWKVIFLLSCYFARNMDKHQLNLWVRVGTDDRAAWNRAHPQVAIWWLAVNNTGPSNRPGITPWMGAESLRLVDSFYSIPAGGQWCRTRDGRAELNALVFTLFIISPSWICFLYISFKWDPKAINSVSIRLLFFGD